MSAALCLYGLSIVSTANGSGRRCGHGLLASSSLVSLKAGLLRGVEPSLKPASDAGSGKAPIDETGEDRPTGTPGCDLSWNQAGIRLLGAVVRTGIGTIQAEHGGRRAPATRNWMVVCAKGDQANMPCRYCFASCQAGGPVPATGVVAHVESGIEQHSTAVV